jgi:hypothetical protein
VPFQGNVVRGMGVRGTDIVPFIYFSAEQMDGSPEIFLLIESCFSGRHRCVTMAPLIAGADHGSLADNSKDAKH